MNILAIGRTLTVSLLMGGCATTFTGSAHVPGGPEGCKTKCAGWNLEYEGMVAIGEYGDACICARPGAKASVLEDGAGAAVANVAGVEIQRQRAQVAATATARP